MNRTTIIILIAGGALIVVGFAMLQITAYSLAMKAYEKSVPLALFTLGPQEQEAVRLPINDTSKTIYIQLSSTDSNPFMSPPRVPIDITVEDPESNLVLSANDVMDELLKVEPSITGNYLISIKNSGDTDTQFIITVIFAVIPSTAQETLDLAGPAVAGVFMMGVGILTVAAGGILFVLDRRKAKAPPGYLT